MDVIKHPRQTKARKAHRCNFCGGKIEIGAAYFDATYVDCDLFSWKTHTHCAEIAEKLRMYDECDEGVSESDFSELIDYQFDNLNPNLLHKDYPSFLKRLNIVLLHHGVS
jgi:hypothetical protein